MSQYARTQSDLVWIAGYTIPTADWEDLDRKVFGAVNGDRGGAYLPSVLTGPSKWTIGGSGLQVTSRIRCATGGLIRYTEANTCVIPDGTWPELLAGHPGRTVVLVQPVLNFVTPFPHLWSRLHSYAGAGSVALASKSPDERIEAAELYLPLRVHDGSTLTKAKFSYRVASRRTYAPIAMPQFRVVRVPINPTAPGVLTKQPLKSTSDGQGFASPTLVRSGAEWYTDGAEQTFEYVCDQNHVIDVANYHYLAHIVDERGVTSLEDPFDGIRWVERKTDVHLVNQQDIVGTLTGLPSIDNITAVAGDRILVTNTDDVIEADAVVASSPNNGIWIAAAGAWARALDADASSDFTPGFLVNVFTGRINRGSTWQLTSPRVDLGTTRIRLQPARPRGNIYHSVTTTFAITDLRLQ